MAVLASAVEGLVGKGMVVVLAVVVVRSVGAAAVESGGPATEWTTEVWRSPSRPKTPKSARLTSSDCRDEGCMPNLGTLKVLSVFSIQVLVCYVLCSRSFLYHWLKLSQKNLTSLAKFLG